MKYYVVPSVTTAFKFVKFVQKGSDAPCMKKDEVVAPSKDQIVADLQQMLADNQKSFVAFSKIEDAQAYANRKDTTRAEDTGFIVLEINTSGKGLKHAKVEIEAADGKKATLNGKTVLLSKSEFVQAHLGHLDASLKDAPVALNIKGSAIVAKPKVIEVDPTDPVAATTTIPRTPTATVITTMRRPSRARRVERLAMSLLFLLTAALIATLLKVGGAAFFASPMLAIPLFVCVLAVAFNVFTKDAEKTKTVDAGKTAEATADKTAEATADKTAEATADKTAEATADKTAEAAVSTKHAKVVKFGEPLIRSASKQSSKPVSEPKPILRRSPRLSKVG